MEKVFNKDFKPVQAIIVFNQDDYNSNYYLESRKIESTKLGYQMTAGAPLSKSTLAKLMDNIDVEDVNKLRCKSIFPKNLLYYQVLDLEPFIIWHLKSDFNHLSFSKGLNIKDGNAHLPSLIFKLKGKELSVFAVKTNSPNEETKLYHAPFHNVYDNGTICMGSAKVDKSNDIIEIMKNYEKAFFSSKFSHLHFSGSPINGNLNTYLSKLIKSGNKFDNKVLKTFGGETKFPVKIKDLLTL